MFEDFIKAVSKAAIAMAIIEGAIVEEDGILLNKETVELVKEIEEVNRQYLIDAALANDNRTLFMQLTER